MRADKLIRRLSSEIHLSVYHYFEGGQNCLLSKNVDDITTGDLDKMSHYNVLKIWNSCVNGISVMCYERERRPYHD